MRDGPRTGECFAGDDDIFHAVQFEASPLGNTATLRTARLLPAQDLGFSICNSKDVRFTEPPFSIVGEADHALLGEGGSDVAAPRGEDGHDGIIPSTVCVSGGASRNFHKRQYLYRKDVLQKRTYKPRPLHAVLEGLLLRIQRYLGLDR